MSATKLNVSLIKLYVTLSLLIMIKSANADYNVESYGAKSDGRTDSTGSFVRAWTLACKSATDSTIYVPNGRYLVKTVVFRGPCKSRITVRIDGTVVAPSDARALGKSGYWISFIKVDRLTIVGGTLDGQGGSLWACKNSGKSCPGGARVSSTLNVSLHLSYKYEGVWVIEVFEPNYIF